MIHRLIQSRHNNLQGILWMVYASFWFAVMTTIIRHLSTELGTFQMVFLRNILCVTLMLPWFITVGHQHMHPKQPWKLYGYRSLSGLLGMWGIFYAIRYIPLTEAIALTFTVPLFTTIMAMLFLKEKVDYHRWIGIIIGFVGVLVILRPGSSSFQIAALLVIGAAFTWSISNILVKKITSSDPPKIILFIMMLIMTPLALPTALIDWQPLDVNNLLWVLALAFVTNQAQGALIYAYRATDINIVMPYDFSRLVFITILAYLLFDEIIDLPALMGALIIFGSSIYVVHRETAEARKK
jgi:drug/metabolite transporter (DMT)-like permease